MITETRTNAATSVECTTLPRPDWQPFYDRIFINGTVKEQLVTDGLWARVLDETRLDAFTTAYHGLDLLVGPPGTGKTTLAKGVANEVATRLRTELEFNHVHVDQLFAGQLGETPKRVATVFDDIRSEARRGVYQILLVDELGSLFTKREELSGRTDPADVRRAVTTALQAVDDLAGAANVYCLGTSNQPGIVDMALVDRADRVVRVELAAADRRRLLVDVFGDWNAALGTDLPTEPGALDSLVEASEGLSGRQLKKAVRSAVLMTGTGGGPVTYDRLVKAAQAVTYDQVVASVKQQAAALEATDGDFLGDGDALPGSENRITDSSEPRPRGAEPGAPDTRPASEDRPLFTLKPRRAVYDTHGAHSTGDLLARVRDLVVETLRRVDYPRPGRVEDVLRHDEVEAVVFELVHLEALDRLEFTVDELTIAVDVAYADRGGDRLDVPAEYVLPSLTSDELAITLRVTDAGRDHVAQVNAFDVTGPVTLTAESTAETIPARRG